MGIRGKIVGIKKVSDLKVLRNGLAVIAGNARAKYCGALMPPEAVSIGKPGIEIGAPGRPGLASNTSSCTTMFCEGSGVSEDGAEATTVND